MAGKADLLGAACHEVGIANVLPATLALLRITQVFICGYTVTNTSSVRLHLLLCTMGITAAVT